MADLPKLKHADGTAVTAQEAYNSFMNTRVLIVNNGTTYEAINMVWHDNNSAWDDPANVVYVKLSYVTTVDATVVIRYTEAGASPLNSASGGT